MTKNACTCHYKDLIIPVYQNELVMNDAWLFFKKERGDRDRERERKR
jgi:hypothetical protein